MSDDPFDRDALTQLRDLGGPALLAHMIPMVLTQVAARADELGSGAGDGDWTRVAFAAHGLRSTAGNVGARRVSELAAGIERAARAGEAAAAAGLLADLPPALDDMRRYLAGVLAEDAP